MTNKSDTKKIVWLQRNGFWEDVPLDPANPPVRYLIVKTQNTIKPRVNDVMRESEVQDLIDQGVTVNIST